MREEETPAAFLLSGASSGAPCVSIRRDSTKPLLDSSPCTPSPASVSADMPGISTFAQQRQTPRRRPSPPLPSSRSASSSAFWSEFQNTPTDEPSDVNDPFGCEHSALTLPPSLSLTLSPLPVPPPRTDPILNHADRFLPDSPQLPSLGAPILNDAETRELHQFLSAAMGETTSPTFFGDDISHSDFYNIPPEYMASTTSLVHQQPATSASESHGFNGIAMYSPSPLDSDGISHLQQHHHHHHHQNQNQNNHQGQNQHHHHQQRQYPLTPIPTLEPTHEDLAAAAFLHTGASTGRSPHRAAFDPISTRHALATAPAHSPLVRHQTMQEFHQDGWRGPHSQATENGEYTLSTDPASWDHSRRLARPSLSRPHAPQWGSDQSFNTSVLPFVPPSSKESLEALEGMSMNLFNTLSPRQPAVYSSSSSPSSTECSPTVHAHSRKSSQALHLDLELEAPPKKRQKSASASDDTNRDSRSFKTTKVRAEVTEIPTPLTPHPGAASISSPTKVPVKRRKSESAPAAAANGSAGKSVSKRRKSSSTPVVVNGAGKRINLTNEQKRENHNNSEKRRRGVIQDGFSGLQELVPGLVEGGYSKFTKLKMAADYLEELVAENKRLWAQRDELRALRGLSPVPIPAEENYNNSRVI
jgi:hypothetical protein